MRRILATTGLILIVMSPVFASTSRQAPGSSLTAREQQVWAEAAHKSKFSDVPHTTRASCDANEPPQELTTPDPVLAESISGQIEVSIIIGADGHVHSPLILESAGAEQDAKVLRAVTKWRFRPATCNGVATDAEATIAFSSR
jgi:TonB family protein